MDQSTSCTLQCFFPLLLYFCLFSLDSVASAALLNSEPPNPVNPLGISTFKELIYYHMYLRVYKNGMLWLKPKGLSAK